ncbi:DUF6270 domain-containing protein [Corynebacterium halotolerans]|uniref:DUF6270 domain-containing protein n=1 Tax=Corynebacterium halotolerans TaxID=225326 RepID=UPI003CE8907C
MSIWGSCISRDTLDLAATYADQLDVGSYAARQTWISATSKPLPYPGDDLTSNFQSRMVKGDFASNALETILKAESKSDAIVLDVIDDRFSTAEVPSGEHFTYSSTAQKAQVAEAHPRKRLIRTGSDEHAELWSQAAQQVRQELDPFMDKVFVFGGPWAVADQEGNNLKPHLGKSIEDWNTTNTWFLEQLKDLGFTVLELPDELAISDTNHRWGASPFHYLPAAYDYWAGEMLERLGRKS